MIRYQLCCDQGHQFESWFQSSDAFDTLANANQISCIECGSTTVTRALMAPSVAVSKAADVNLSTPQTEAEAALTKMRKHVEDTSDYVGLSFASEARKMHDGETPERPIYGEAKLEDAKQLIDDGVPVAPLPFMPKQKTN